ncbi:23S rRNA (uracil(1939)-C(5))-methyltransferase RlmD [Lamprobacter modestohalophilus]|uniref:23S rRNA (uracil(1939)-C(5))-methyltransferase RlmD n=1 Tax=Lamprobacter modestohalophilus TaxID=1064514 RepID=UPI002ADEC5D1|nr:23S rRNA (uracil(1939)-C(5))-methyltransferase RlmD [Lamprobacter modestohalophilus]MEA1050386.1 23S rRNA (uracil(1939)-C(5))-methyltransferase RlmD [Lamprobacter modestohalophilus]
MSKKRKPLPSEPIEAVIESLAHDGRGIARVEGKTVFVHGALAGERVRFRLTRRLRRHDEALVTEVLEPSAQRVEPRCAHFGVCGGCALQHMDPAAQIENKQAILADVLQRIGGLAPARWLPPLAAADAEAHWGYRRKARLGVRWVPKKGRVLVGFRERGSSFIADVQRCEVLHPAVGEHLEALARLIEGLSIRERLPQIEVAQGDGPVVLVFRVLDPPSAADCDRLLSFAAQSGFHVYLQEGGVETVRPLPGQEIELSYRLPNQGLTLAFEPNDFTQVNLELNRQMIDQALALLDPQPNERLLDLFCGLGNFTLPLARRARELVGVEGDAGLVARAQANAVRNGIENVRFYTADLYAQALPHPSPSLPLTAPPWLDQPFDKALLDPPRSGALEVLDWLASSGVQRILYVSCYPATLARDAAKLVGELGFRLEAAGAMDMFPHTAHLEAMALFERR